VNISSGNLLHNKKSNDGTLKKRNIVVGHFVSLVYDHVMQASNTSLKDMTIVGATYQTILNRLMLQSCQLCDVGHDFSV
jgi:hypothetical protein